MPMKFGLIVFATHEIRNLLCPAVIYYCHNDKTFINYEMQQKLETCMLFKRHFFLTKRKFLLKTSLMRTDQSITVV